MKYFGLLLLIVPVLFGTVACSNSSRDRATVTENIEKKMSIQSSGLKDGVLGDSFGGKGSQVNPNKIPNYSIPFEVKHAPKGTKSYALVLEDRDAYEMTKGITWVHWAAANIMTDQNLRVLRMQISLFKVLIVG